MDIIMATEDGGARLILMEHLDSAAKRWARRKGAQFAHATMATFPNSEPAILIDYAGIGAGPAARTGAWVSQASIGLSAFVRWMDAELKEAGLV